MRTPDQVIGTWIMYALVALVAALLLWWVGDSVIDAIRAPEVAKTQAAVQANDSLAKDNARLEAQNETLSKVLTKRSTFEKGVRADIDGMRRSLAAKKATNSKVREWAETEIPVEVLQP